MTDTFALSPEEIAGRDDDEAARLAECAAEPLRTIGRIQSYGILLGVDEHSGAVVLASANAEQFLGRVLRDESAELDRVLSHGRAVDPIRAELDGEPMDVIVHRGTSPLLVEFEPLIPELDYVRTGVVGAIQNVATLSDVDAIRSSAAREIKALTGFDRVMCYDFHPDGHGQVVADAREPDMESYFGLHFPSSDIPMQARALYLEKRSRVIADTEDAGVPILSAVAEDQAVDLASCEMRAVSPHHLTFMRNMGQASTFSLALVDEGRLIGMITCAHRTPRRLPVLMRRALEVLAIQVSGQLASLRRIHALQRQLDAQQRRSALIATLLEGSDPGGALTTGERTVLDIVPCDGAALRLGGAVHTVGDVPPAERLFRVVERLGPGAHTVETLPLDHSEAAAEIPGIAGLLVTPLGTDGDCLVFVRSEVAQTVEWLGDQRAENREHTLSPRRSFSAWRESVTGHCLPWGDYAQDAVDFGQSLQDALGARVQADLAALAVRDPLTGLHNRRFLEDFLGKLPAAAHAEVTVVYLDLDDFKGINDTHGHDTGDAVLRAVAQRVRAAVRESDWVVRLGGDEFLVICPSTDLSHGREIAARTVSSIAGPIVIGDTSVSVHASAGVVSGTPESLLGDVVTSADAAMYRAKQAGGGRISA